MHGDLQRFLSFLEEKGELVRVKEPVSPVLEITALADRVVKAGGPALLFENVEGSDLPLAIGVYGTRQRMAWALGLDDLDELGTRLRELMDVKVGGGLVGLASNLPKLRELASLPPKRVRRAPVQEVVWRGDDVDLGKLPVLTCWPQDGGPFVTLPLVISKDPASGEVNIGMYRMQVMGKNVTGMHWQRHKTGARHLESAKRLGQRLEVAVALGGDPALTYAATAPIPPIPGINEYSLTGYLRGRGVELVKGVTVDLEVPANAEIVLEGYVDPDEDWVVEGPFGDHTGFYTLQDLYPAFHVTAITMRREAIYPATIVGRPPMEDAYLIEASERLFLVPAQLILPEIVDYHMPPAGIAHNLVNVVIKKGYPGQAYKVGNGLLGLGQMMFAKVILVTDADVPPNDHPGFWRTVLANAVPGRDHQIAKGPIDVLDHASRAWSYGSKLIIDGTVKHAEEVGAPGTSGPAGVTGAAGAAAGAAITPGGGAAEPTGAAGAWEPGPERDRTHLPAHAEVLDQHQPGNGFWFLTTRKERADQGRHIGEWAAHHVAARGVRLIAVLDHETDPRDFEDAVWTLLNNIDPERDVQVIDAGHGAGPVWVVDATPKIAAEGFARAWPDKITMTPEVEERTDALAERLGL